MRTCLFPLLLAVLTLSAFAESPPGTTPEDWENPQVFARNQTPGHSCQIPFADEISALEGDRSSSPYFRSLNGDWRFLWVENPEQTPADFYETTFPDADWDTIPVPSNWQLEGFGYPMFRNVAHTFHSEPPRVPRQDNPTGLYRTSFTVPRDWSGRRTFLHFEGVKSASYVWVNGNQVGYDQGGMEPSEYNITPYLQEGENTLAVMVLRFSDGTYLECQDMWRLSGIFRDVYLYSTPGVHLFDSFAITDLDEDYKDAFLRFEVTLQNLQERRAPASVLEMQLFDERQAPVLDEPYRIHVGELKPQSEVRLLINQNITAPRLWSAEQPYLYTALFRLLDQSEGTEFEITRKRFGFREVEIVDRAIVVNGVPIKFNGVNRHEHHPRTGRMMTREAMEEDLRLMKQFNINLVRTSHYPPDAEFLDLADEYGIYVVDEVNDEAHAHPEVSADRNFRESYLDRTERMVLRDRSHPSIVFWSAGNESGTGQNLADLIKRGHELDPSRPAWMYGATSTTPDQDFEEIIGPRYPSPQILEEFGRIPETEDARPSFMDEYAAATGNSIGHFDRFWEVIRKYPRLTGGAIWDWISPGIEAVHRTTPDSSRNGHDGTLFGRARFVDAGGRSALALSGHDEWIELYRDPRLDLDGEGLTLLLHVYPQEWNGTNSLITKGDQFGIEQVSENRIEFYIFDEDKVSLQAELPSDWVGNWHQLLASYDGRNLRLYRNGSLLGERSHTGRIDRRPWPICIGKNSKTQGQNHRGPISNALFDEARIYARALAPEQIEGDAGDALVHLELDEIEDGAGYFDMGIGARTYGLVWPDREVQPELWQVKKTGQPIAIEPLDEALHRFRIQNRHYFRDLDHLDARWYLRNEERVLHEGILDLDVPAGESREFDLSRPTFAPRAGADYWIEFSFRLAGDEIWADAGHEVAWEQFQLPLSESLRETLAATGTLEVREERTRFRIRGSDFEWVLSKDSGLFERLIFRGEELIRAGPRLDFWRAPLANELDEWRKPPIAATWYEVGLDRFQPLRTDVELVEQRDRKAFFRVTQDIGSPQSPFSFRSRTDLTIGPEGEVQIVQQVETLGEIPEWMPGEPMWLPTMGHQLEVSPDLSQIEWYGRGPFENYPDRKTGARTQIFASDIEDFYVPYLIPQDHGNRSDVRWLSLTNREGMGLWITGDRFHFSAFPYAEDHLSRAGYTFQLETDDHIYLNLDHRVTGVGGTPVPTLHDHRVKPGHFEWKICLRPFDARETRPVDLGRMANLCD